ncbi:hypothetical protein FQZ97_940030 [compost metagenome]
MGHDRRLVEEAAAGDRLAAGGDLDMRLGAGTVDETGHPLALALGDQRAEFGGRVVLQAGLEAGHGIGQVGHEVVVDLLAGIDAAGGGAVLPGVVEAEGADAGHHVSEVGIVEDDHRRLAAQFHMGAFHAFRGATDDGLAGAHRAGQRHHAHQRMRHQRAAHAGATAEHDVHHARRQ